MWCGQQGSAHAELRSTASGHGEPARQRGLQTDIWRPAVLMGPTNLIETRIQGPIRLWQERVTGGAKRAGA